MVAPSTRNQSVKQRGATSSCAAPKNADEPEASDTGNKLTLKMFSQALDSLQESVCAKIGAAIRDLQADVKLDIDIDIGHEPASLANFARYPLEEAGEGR